MNTWYYQQGEQSVGPFTWEVLGKLKSAAVIVDSTPVKDTDRGDWRAFAEVINQNISATDHTTPPNKLRYYYLDGNRQPVGPFELDTLRSLHSEGIITADTLTSGPGDAQWSPVSELLGISETQPPAISPSAPIDRNIYTPKRRPFEKFALMMGVTLGFYAVYMIPSYSRDIKAITGKPRIDFQPLLILGILGLALVLMVTMMTDDVVIKDIFGFIGGLPLGVITILWAFDLESHGKLISKPGRQDSLGAYVLVLTIIDTVIGLFNSDLCAIVSVVIALLAVWLLQKEINLYAPVPQ